MSTKCREVLNSLIPDGTSICTFHVFHKKLKIPEAANNWNAADVH